MGRGREPPKWKRRRIPMDRDSNYVAVGAFVLLVITMAVSFVFWYTDQRDKRTYQRYEIYFPGSVSGLTAGNAVQGTPITATSATAGCSAITSSTSRG